MASDKDDKQNESFPKEVDEASIKLMADSIRYAQSDPLIAVGALAMAAGRAAAMSGLPMSLVLNLFACQFEGMKQTLQDKGLTDKEKEEDNFEKDLMAKFRN